MRRGKGLALMLVCALLAGCAGTVRMPLVEGGPLVQEDFWVWRDGEAVLKLEDAERGTLVLEEGDQTARGLQLGDDVEKFQELYEDAYAQVAFEFDGGIDMVDENRNYIMVYWESEGVFEGRIRIIYLQEGWAYDIEEALARIGEKQIHWASDYVTEELMASLTEEEKELCYKFRIEPESLFGGEPEGDYRGMWLPQLSEEDWEMAKDIGKRYVENRERMIAAGETAG